MILAFGDAIAVLGLLTVLAVCGGILFFHFALLFRLGRLTRVESAAMVCAFIPIVAFLTSAVVDGDRDYNPPNASLDRLVGTYSHDDLQIVLRRDGTYSSRNVRGLGSGTWSHRDWNLTFTGSPLKQPRWITRNGTPGILPYYDGVDMDEGPLLLKQ